MAVLDASRPPRVQFDVEVHAPITRGLNALHPEDKLLAKATVRVAVEGEPTDREVTILEWIADAEAALTPLKEATFIVSFYTDALAGRPPRAHPELRRTGWAPVRLPAPHDGLTVPAPTRRHDPGPAVR